MCVCVSEGVCVCVCVSEGVYESGRVNDSMKGTKVLTLGAGR